LDVTAGLSSQSATFSTQPLTATLATSLLGQSATFSPGALGVASGDVTVALDPVPPATFSAGQLQVGTAATAKSGVSRQWLIDYYTSEFAKKDKPVDIQGLAKAKTAAARKKLIKAAEVEESKAVEKMVTKAERDLEVLTTGMKDAQAAREFTYNLVQQAAQMVMPGLDFMAVAEQYQNRIREDDELMLLSMVL
jgi:hypothetical protein